MSDDALLDRRLVVVTGKGGTGKSTLSAALALSAAQQGKKVLVCEVVARERVADFFGRPPSGTQIRELQPNLYSVHVRPREAMREYALMTIKYETLYKIAFENAAARYFLAAAPSLAEIVMLGKVWWHAAREMERGRPRWDLVVLDAARDVFTVQGAGAPVSAVAERAGVGMGTLYRRYGSKTELLQRLCVLAMQQVLDAAENALLASDPWTGLSGYIRACIDLRSGALVSLAGQIETTVEMRTMAGRSMARTEQTVAPATRAHAVPLAPGDVRVEGDHRRQDERGQQRRMNIQDPVRKGFEQRRADEQCGRRSQRDESHRCEQTADVSEPISR